MGYCYISYLEYNNFYYTEDEIIAIGNLAKQYNLSYDNLKLIVECIGSFIAMIIVMSAVWIVNKFSK